MKSLLCALALLALLGCSSTTPLPPKAAELNRSGVEALERGDLETADARFSLALEYSPRFVEAITNQALVELQRGNFERARQLLERARRLNPDVAQPHHGLGVLAEREERPDIASRHYAEALRVDPGFAPARLNLGRMLFAAGKLEHARSQFKRLTEVAAAEPLGWTGLSEALLRLGRVDESESVMQQAFEQFPQQPELQILLARSLIRRARFEEAIAELEPLANGRDDIAVAALGWIATAELAGGHAKSAVRFAERALALDPHDAVSVYALAMSLDALDAPHAVAWLERARQLAPDDTTVNQALARRGR